MAQGDDDIITQRLFSLLFNPFFLVSCVDECSGASYVTTRTRAAADRNLLLLRLLLLSYSRRRRRREP